MSITITNEDGSMVSIPIDPRNNDYQEYLKESGKTHDEVVADMEREEAASEKTLKTEHNKQKALRVSARSKLVALGFTGPEIRAFFREADD